MTFLPLPAAEYLSECVNYEDGALIWKTRPVHHFSAPRVAAMWNAKNAGNRAGRKMPQGNYRQLAIDGVRYLEHRVIAAMHGIDTSQTIDHRDRDPTNNRVSNLRAASQAQNSRNQTGWAKKSSRVGTWQTANGRWIAYIRAQGKHTHLGTFASEGEAIAARCTAEDTHYGEFAAEQNVRFSAPADMEYA